MGVVYHAVPREMRGTIIYPLERLAEVHPDLHATQTPKYAGREQVRSFTVPDLNRSFTDTVHCGPIHPYRLFAARWALGFDPSAHSDTRHFTGLFFEIPVERIRPLGVVWYRWETLWINGAPGEDVPLVPPLDEFEPFNRDRYAPLPAVPAAHLAYLQRMHDRGQPPLMFVHIPHVLVGGPIDVSGLRVVSWADPPDDRGEAV